MYYLFRYNWQVRDEWFEWCKQLSEEELLRERVGGVGGILKTLFHVVDVEYSWIQRLKGKADFEEPFEKYNTLEKVKELSQRFHGEVSEYITQWKPEMEELRLTVEYENGRIYTYTYGEVLRHMIAHEIHHIGQLSVWSRELGLEPISANLIRRGLF